MRARPSRDGMRRNSSSPWAATGSCSSAESSPMAAGCTARSMSQASGRSEVPAMSVSLKEPASEQQDRLDLLRLPLLGSFLRWRGSRRLLQLGLLALSAVLILHGLFGPTLAPKNLATLLAWIHYRGILVLVLLVAGNLFCFACPFLLARDLARRFFRPALSWPRPLRNKWLA